MIFQFRQTIRISFCSALRRRLKLHSWVSVLSSVIATTSQYPRTNTTSTAPIMSSLSLKQINQIVSSEKLVGMFPPFLDTPPMLKYKYPVVEWEKLKSCRVPYPDWSGDSVFEWENGNRKKGGKIIGKKSGKGVMGMKVFRFYLRIIIYSDCF